MNHGSNISKLGGLRWQSALPLLRVILIGCLIIGGFPTAGVGMAVAAPTSQTDRSTAPQARLALDLPATPSTSTVNLPASKDTYITSDSLTVNFGLEKTLYTSIAGSGDYRTLIAFDTSSIPPNSTVMSASLVVKLGNGSNWAEKTRNVNAYRLTSSWGETTANWNDRQAGVPWASAGGDFDAGSMTTVAVGDPGFYTWDVASIVQGWVNDLGTNHGFLLQIQSSDNVWKEWGSRSNLATADRPQLIVEYVDTPLGISGMVWDDVNRDGVVDGGEPGLPNVDVALYAGACSDLNFTPVQSQTTGSDGTYSLTAPDAAPYCVRVDENTLPADYGTTASQNPQDVDLSSGPLTAPVNFGYASIYAADRLTVGVFAPCIDHAWLQTLASTHSATIITADISACVFTLAGDAADLDALGAELASHPTDRYDHPDVLDYGVFTPNDPDYGNATIVYAPQQINAPAAWDSTRGDPNLILAVIDTGIDFSHPEFAGRILPGYDFVNKDADPSDDNGHGTHVAGIAAAGMDNALGMAGIAGQVKILPIKVLNASNVGWMSDVAAGITYAVDQGARVINLSLAATGESLAVRDAITYAVSKGVVVIAAGGNDNSSVARYPAVYDSVVAVGATDYNNSRWALSNFGPNIDLMAPGALIWSARPGSTFAFMSGTSMAAPHAAGVAALMLSVNPTLTPDQIKQVLQETAVDMGDAGYDSMYGYGQIDAGAALGEIPAGVAVPPVTSLETELVQDLNANGLLDPGDTLGYTIVAANSGSTPLANVVISATVPANTTYVADSTTLNGIPVLDAGSTLFPLDEGSLAIGSVPANNSSRVSFRVVAAMPPRGVYAILATVEIQTELGLETLVAESEVAGTLVKASVDKTAARSGDTLIYTVTTDYVGAELLQNVTITTAIPSGTTYVPGSVNAGGSESGGVVTWDLGSEVVGMAGYVEGTGPSSGTVADNFDPTGVFSGTDGLQNWSGDWTEVGESDGPNAGHVRVPFLSGHSGVLILGDERPYAGASYGAVRVANLSGYVAATLLFDYKRSTMEGADYLTVEASANGGGAWTEIGRYTAGSDAAWQSAAFDISGYISANTAIRFATHFVDSDFFDNFYLDNVQIQYSAPSADEGKITWSTFQGGGGSDNNNAVTVDSSGNVYGAGKSNAAWGSPVRAYAGGDDALITKFDSNGTLLWHTFLGGNSGLVNDYANGVAVDSDGNVYVTGQSVATWGSPLRAFAGDWDTYVAKLDSSGTLLWHTFLGGTGYDNGNDIALDGSGNVIVAGYSGVTWGSPVRAFTTSSGNADAYVAKLSNAGALTWHTFLGGTGYDNATGIKVDGSGNIYVGGQSAVTWGSPERSFTVSGTNEDGFAANLTSGGVLSWHTFLGGSGVDEIRALALDDSNDIYVGGYSTATWGSPMRGYTGANDGLVIKLSNAGALIWHSFLGGAANDTGTGIGVDAGGTVYVGGLSQGTWGTPVRAYSGGFDGFAAAVNSNGNLLWNTFQGSSGTDINYGAVVDANGSLYVAGYSTATWGTPVKSYTSGTDSYVVKLKAAPISSPSLGSVLGAGPTLVTAGDQITVTLILTASQDITSVGPDNLVITGTNGVGAQLVKGPTPLSALVGAPGTTYTWVYQATDSGNIGQLTFGGDATDGTNTWPWAESNSVIVHPPLTFGVTVNDPPGVAQVQATAFISDSGDLLPSHASNTPATQLPASIGDRVWDDQDGDAVQDPGEPGIPSVTVRLTRSDSTSLTAITDGDGNYDFTDLTAGTYTVTVDAATVPPVYEFVTTLDVLAVTLTNGQDDNAADFGFKARSSSIGDTLFYDTNANGKQDAGEPGLGNISLDLYLDDGDGIFEPVPALGSDTFVKSAISNAAGAYRLDLPVDGGYFVDVTDERGLLAGLSHTVGSQSMTDPSPVIPVALGQYVQNADFGYVRLPAAGHAILGDQVWVDENGDGVRQLLEPAVIDTQVCATPTVGGAAVCVQTDVNGRYLLELPVGGYTVTLTAPPLGLAVITPHPLAVSLAQGDQHLNADFGLGASGSVLGSIGGQIWQDLPVDDVVDGFYDAATEPGLPNVSVDLIVDINKDGVWDSGDAYVATLSDLGGLFRFRGLLADRYLVRVSDTLAVLRRFAPTVTATTGSTPTDNTNKVQPFAIDLAAGQTNTLADFGYREYEAFGTGSTLNPGMIGDQIWLDVDSNGLFALAAGDQPLPGVTVEARSAGVVMATATTGGDGKYLLMDLPLGRTYDVTVTDLFGVLEKYLPTALGSAGLDNQNKAQPYSTFLALASTDFKADFGYAHLSTVGGRLWWDGDQDGIQDVNEPGIPGVGLDLLNAAGDVIESAVSDGAGGYAFADLAPATYTVTVNLAAFQPGAPLAGWTASPTGAADDTLDSDGDPDTHRAAATAALGAQLGAVDFGFMLESAAQVAVSAPSYVRFGDDFQVSITVTNTGNTWISQLPVCLNYDPDYITLRTALPSPDGLADTGEVTWPDGLAEPSGGRAPTAAGELAPGETVHLLVTFGGKGDSTGLPGETTPFTATVMGGNADPDGSAGAIPSLPVVGQSATNGGVIIVNPTGVQMADMGAQVAADGVRLSWRTVDESRVVGFHVWRQAGEQAPERITAEPVVARFGGQSTGQAYSMFDPTPLDGTTRYELEILLRDGLSQRRPLGTAGGGFMIYMPLATR